MAPPGLTMLSVSPRAWEASRRARLPRFYWDFAEAKRYLDKDETPYTPAVSLLFGLQASLHLIMDEGLPNVFARHERLRDIVREGARRIGFRPFAPDDIASRTVTALLPPEGIPGKAGRGGHARARHHYRGRAGRVRAQDNPHRAHGFRPGGRYARGPARPREVLDLYPASA